MNVESSMQCYDKNQLQFSWMERKVKWRSKTWHEHIISVRIISSQLTRASRACTESTGERALIFISICSAQCFYSEWMNEKEKRTKHSLQLDKMKQNNLNWAFFLHCSGYCLSGAYTLSLTHIQANEREEKKMTSQWARGRKWQARKKNRNDEPENMQNPVSNEIHKAFAYALATSTWDMTYTWY